MLIKPFGKTCGNIILSSMSDDLKNNKEQVLRQLLGDRPELSMKDANVLIRKKFDTGVSAPLFSKIKKEIDEDLSAKTSNSKVKTAEAKGPGKKSSEPKAQSKVKSSEPKAQSEAKAPNKAKTTEAKGPSKTKSSEPKAQSEAKAPSKAKTPEAKSQTKSKTPVSKEETAEKATHKKVLARNEAGNAALPQEGRTDSAITAEAHHATPKLGTTTIDTFLTKPHTEMAKLEPVHISDEPLLDLFSGHEAAKTRIAPAQHGEPEGLNLSEQSDEGDSSEDELQNDEDGSEDQQQGEALQTREEEPELDPNLPKFPVHLEIKIPEATEVHLSGSFNRWRIGEFPLRKTSYHTWVFEGELPQGDYQYKFVVDKKTWFLDMSRERVLDKTGVSHVLSVVGTTPA